MTDRDDYLWDGSGEADDDIKLLERTLAAHRGGKPPRPRRLRGLAVVLLGGLTAVVGYRFLPLENVPEPIVRLVHDGPLDQISIEGGQRIRVDYTYSTNRRYSTLMNVLRARELPIPYQADTSSTNQFDLPGWSREDARAYVTGALHSGRWQLVRELHSADIDQVLEHAADSQTFFDDRLAAPPVSFRVDVWTFEGEERQAGYLFAEDLGSLQALAQTTVLPCTDACYFVFARVDGGFRTYVAEDGRGLGESRVSDEKATAVRGRSALTLELDDGDATNLFDLTQSQIGNRLLVFVDTQLVSTPVVMQAITGGKFELAVTIPAGLRTEPYLRGLARAFSWPDPDLSAEIQSITSVPPTASPTQLFLLRAALPVSLGIAAGLLLLAGMGRIRPLDPELARGRGGALRLAGSETLLSLLFLAGWVASFKLAIPVNTDSFVPAIGSHDGLGALGLIPFLVAAALIESVCLAVPRLRRWRHGSPSNRRRLSRLALLATPVVALLMAINMVPGLPDSSASWVEYPFQAISREAAILYLVLACSGFALLAAGLDRWGLGNGYLLTAAAVALGANWERIPDTLTAFELGGLSVGAAGLAACTMWLLAGRVRGSIPATAGVVPWLPVVLLGIVAGPLGLSVDLVGIWLPILAVALAGVSIALSLAFRAEASGNGSSRVLASESGFWLRTLLSSAIVALGFAAFVALAPRHPILLLVVALATPVGMDLVVAWKARFREPHLREVWTLRCPEDVDIAVDALVTAGIDVHVDNRYVNTALRWLAGFAPLRVMVPAGFEDQAVEVLESL